MNLQILGKIAFAMIVILPFQPSAIEFRSSESFQEPLKTYKVVSHETHERVLDIVFPRGEANRDYDFVLRFEPSFAPESQIIVKRGVGKVQIVEYTSLSGNIYSKLNSVMANGGKEDAVEMAKMIQVQRRVIEVPTAQVRQWRRSLADNIGASMKTLEKRNIQAEQGIGTITLDGTFYSLWYDQVGGEVSFRLLDHEVNNHSVTGELALVRWINSVRLEVAKRQ